MIKAFMFDLDGTLIDDKYKMSKVTIDTLHKLKAKSYTLVANSGRPIFLSNYVTDPTLGYKFFDYIYGNNGSEFYNNKTNKYELLHYLSAEQIKQMVKLYDNPMFILGVYAELEDGNYILLNREVDNDDIKSWIKARGIKSKVIDFEKNEKSYAKVICLHEKRYYGDALKFIDNHQSDFTSIVHSSFYAIEIVPKGVSKASAVKHFLKLSNISKDELIAFGDSSNDIPMLKECNGVLMGNANEEYKKIFNNQTLSVNDDGVAYYLKRNNYVD